MIKVIIVYFPSTKKSGIEKDKYKHYVEKHVCSYKTKYFKISNQSIAEKNSSML